MKYKYDVKTDILLIQMGTEKPDFAEQRENIITHYNKNGKPIEIEILDASKTVVKLFETIVGCRSVQSSTSIG
ncbi:DUF2283 domain-containing protein [Candidatus Micrarchaeota archaeon]|nr:DUF2283 domain-containing protein [Candidatus Micrarchaeota archaeon]